MNAYFTCVVVQALQFDPTLRSEIEYDLKQFEKAKRDKLAGRVLLSIVSFSICWFASYEINSLRNCLQLQSMHLKRSPLESLLPW